MCLTQENKKKPWILFEAGALAKGLSTGRVCTFLIDLSPADIESPLSQFNHTLPNREGLWALVQTLNASLPSENQLPEPVLGKVFEAYWPQFEAEFQQALSNTDSAPPSAPRSEKDILSEILDNSRSMSLRVADLERRLMAPVSASDEVKRMLNIRAALDAQKTQLQHLNEDLTGEPTPVQELQARYENLKKLQAKMKLKKVDEG